MCMLWRLSAFYYKDFAQKIWAEVNYIFLSFIYLGDRDNVHWWTKINVNKQLKMQKKLDFPNPKTEFAFKSGKAVTLP